MKKRINAEAQRRKKKAIKIPTKRVLEVIAQYLVLLGFEREIFADSPNAKPVITINFRKKLTTEELQYLNKFLRMVDKASSILNEKVKADLKDIKNGEEL